MWTLNWTVSEAPNQSMTANGLFTLPDPDSDSDSDSEPYGYIVLFRTFHIGSDLDLDPYLDGFPNGYCIHFRDKSPSQGQISVPITYISIRGSESESEPMLNFCIMQESEIRIRLRWWKWSITRNVSAKFIIVSMETDRLTDKTDAKPLVIFGQPRSTVIVT